MTKKPEYSDQTKAETDLNNAVQKAKKIIKDIKKEKDLPVEVVCIVDRSGSMQTIHGDVIGGINSFIEEQKKVKGKANLTLIEFDDKYNVIQSRQDLQKAKEVTKEDFKPRGMTALNDAIGKAVTEFVALKEANKINKAIFCIMTDGQENASTEFKSKAALKALTERVQKEYDWQFVYLAANQDAFAEGSQYGFTTNMNYAANAQGVASALRSYSANVTSYRSK